MSGHREDPAPFQVGFLGQNVDKRSARRPFLPTRLPRNFVTQSSTMQTLQSLRTLEQGRVTVFRAKYKKDVYHGFPPGQDLAEVPRVFHAIPMTQRPFSIQE